VAGVGAALALLWLDVARAVEGLADLAWLALASLAGWVLADLVSGVVHWWADRIASERFPLLGSTFVRPFREHHEDPLGICRSDWVGTNGNTCIVVLPFVLLACFWQPWPAGGAGGLFASAAFVSLASWSVATNQIHKWAHAPRVPGPVRGLQRAGIFLSPGHHARHHTPPYARRYCITAGRFDALLDAIGLFPALEGLLGCPQPGPLARRRRSAS